jgi:hypothetical protein
LSNISIKKSKKHKKYNIYILFYHLFNDNYANKLQSGKMEQKIKGRINLPFSLANLIVKGSVVAITIITK